MKKMLSVCGIVLLVTGRVFGVDPVVHYTFDDPGNLGKDSAGSFNLTANTGAGFTAPEYRADGKVGGAAYFDGTDGYISPAGIYPHGSFTFAAFIKADDTGVAEITSSLSSRAGFQIYASGGSWRFRINKNDATYDYRIGNAVSTEWTHLAMTFSKSSGPDANNNCTGYFRVYMDGVYLTGLSVSDYTFNDTYTMTLGTKSATGLYRGLIDEVQLYDTALSASAVAKLAAAKRKISLVVMH